MDEIQMKAKKGNNTGEKSISDYFRLMLDAKKSAANGRILNAIKSIERFDLAYKLIPSQFHAAESLYTAPVVPVNNLLGELIWGSIIIQRKRKEIDKYLSFKRSIEPLIIAAKWDEARSLIIDFELSHGASAAIKELAIAITQQAEGTVKQIAYSRRLEAQCNKTPFAFFVRFASERNEDRLTLSGFRRNFRENSDGDAVSPLVSTIICWHGLRQLPNDEDLLSQLLSFEGSGSIFDYFEAYIAVATNLAARSHPQLRTVVKYCLYRMSEIGDQRVINLRRLLEGEYTPSTTPLTATNILSEVRARTTSCEIGSHIEKMIFGLLSDNSPDGGVRRNVHKLSANFFHLDFFQAVFYYLEHKTSASCLDQAVAPGLVALADTTSLRSVFGCSFDVAKDIFAKHSLSTPLGASTQSPTVIPSDNSSDALLFSAIALARNRDIDRLIVLTKTSGLNAIDRAHLQLIAIGACYEAARYIDLLPFALEVSEVRLDALSLLPIVAALEKILPGRLDGRGAVLFSIVTSRVLLIGESDRLEDKLMVATEVAFADRISTPNWAEDDEDSLKLWIEFLRNVLVVQNMLLIDEVNSLRDALNLRVEVLRQLAELDPENRAEYHEEVRDIAFDLSVDEGIRQVNTSRLNVNIQGLTKWAYEHCVDDFERYKELVVGEANAGELSIKPSSGGGNFFDQFLNISLGVADDQLVKLLIRIRNAYLSDPRNGLDAYISLRVRHGSLSGTLSRGLDTRQLLLLRKSEGGPFEAPRHWIDRLSLSENQVTEVTRYFAIFTATFRKSIDDLLQNRLRVKNERNPQGEITVEITDIFVKGLKIDIANGLSFDTFISAVFISYKNAVSTYLESLREYLKSEFLNNAVHALEELSESVGKAINDSETHCYLSDAITNARLDLQASIKVVCGWLEIAQKEDLAQLYTLNQATEIGLNYTRQVRNDFMPKLSFNGVDDSFRLTGVSLILVVDILFIMLDNVYKHAGLPNERTISLKFDLNEEGIIKITMKNDLATTVERSEVASRLDSARKLIAGSDGERKLTEEDKSGLPKLSKLVVQDRADALTFDLVDDAVEVNVMIGYSHLGAVT